MRLNVIPKSMAKRFRYVTDISIDPPTAGTVGYHIFRANSLYDPDKTGVGHQPYGFDQYVPDLYNHVTVLGAKITAVFSLGSPAVANAANNLICGITVKDDDVPILDPELIRENSRGTRWSMITNASNPRAISAKFSTRKFFGKKDVRDNAELTHTATTNPSELAYFHVWVAPCAYNVDAYNATVQVIIDYIAFLSEPNTFGKS